MSRAVEKNQEESSVVPPRPALGLALARLSGVVLGIFFLVQGPWLLWTSGDAAFTWIRGGFLTVYGVVLLLPLTRVGDQRRWIQGYVILIAMTVLFVFLMIATVMFGYMEAAERGERLGVPGREGTMIFIALLQVPVALFLRKPDLME